MDSSSERRKLQIRILVSDFHSALFARMLSSSSPSKEALRLMEIGLKWERIDSDPSSFLWSLNPKQLASASPNQSIPQAAPIDSKPFRHLTAKATIGQKEGDQIMNEWRIDPLAMFEEDVPMSKSARAVISK